MPHNAIIKREHAIMAQAYIEGVPRRRIAASMNKYNRAAELALLRIARVLAQRMIERGEAAPSHKPYDLQNHFPWCLQYFRDNKAFWVPKLEALRQELKEGPLIVPYHEGVSFSEALRMRWR